MEKVNYTIPVAKETVDTMIETLTRENKRLSEENQKLRDKLQKEENGQQDPGQAAAEMDALINRYL